MNQKDSVAEQEAPTPKPGGGVAEEAAQGPEPSQEREPGLQAAQEPALAKRLAAAEALAEERREEYLRSVAELDNVRKRAEREVQRAHRYGNERFAAELLQVVDGLEMGLKAAEEAGVDSLLEGAQATYKLMLSVFEKFGVKQLDPLGETFNPEFHEAMAMQPAPDAEPHAVIQVVQKGYLLQDRLLRPARVIVAQDS